MKTQDIYSLVARSLERSMDMRDETAEDMRAAIAERWQRALWKEWRKTNRRRDAEFKGRNWIPYMHQYQVRVQIEGAAEPTDFHVNKTPALRKLLKKLNDELDEIGRRRAFARTTERVRSVCMRRASFVVHKHPALAKKISDLVEEHLGDES